MGRQRRVLVFLGLLTLACVLLNWSASSPGDVLFSAIAQAQVDEMPVSTESEEAEAEEAAPAAAQQPGPMAANARRAVLFLLLICGIVAVVTATLVLMGKSAEEKARPQLPA